MRAFDAIYVHPNFSPEPQSPTSPSSPRSSAGDKWQYAVVGTALTVAVASGLGIAVGMPGILNAVTGR